MLESHVLLAYCARLMRKKREKKVASELMGRASTWKDMLTARPVPNIVAKTESGTRDDEFNIAIPTKPAWWYKLPPVCWIVRPAKERLFILDEIGQSIWKWCDGKRTVEEIVDLFAEKHNLTFHESRVSVTNYLKLLIERGALAIVL